MKLPPGMICLLVHPCKSTPLHFPKKVCPIYEKLSEISPYFRGKETPGKDIVPREKIWKLHGDSQSQSVKGYQSTPPFQNHPPITRMPPPFLKIPHPPTLPTNQSSHVFLTNRNATVKLSSINTIHVKQQHNVGFFIFKFTLKYMLGNVYINKIHAR